MYKPPQNPFDFMLGLLQNAVQTNQQGIAQRVQMGEQQAIQTGELAQQDIRSQLQALDSALSMIPLDDPNRGQFMQARAALAQGLSLQPKEASKFLAGLTVPGAEGEKVPFGNVLANANRVAQSTVEARQDEVREDEQAQEVALIDRQADADMALQESGFEFQSGEAALDRRLQTVLLTIQNAHEAGQNNLDRIAAAELQEAGFGAEMTMQARQIAAQKFLTKMGIDWERESLAITHENALEFQEIEQTHAYKMFSEELDFRGDEAEKEREFREAYQRAQNKFLAGESSLERALREELTRAGFGHEMDMAEFRAGIDIFLQQSMQEWQSGENALNREQERFLQSEQFTHEEGLQLSAQEHEVALQQSQQDWMTDERNGRQTFEYMLAQQGYQWQATEAEKQRMYDRWVIEAGWKRDDGTAAKTVAATEFDMLMEDMRTGSADPDDPAWYRQVMNSAERAGMSTATADVLARGAMEKARGGTPTLTEDQAAVIQETFSQELDALKAEFPGCAAESIENRMAAGGGEDPCAEYKIRMADWHVRMDQFRQVYGGFPMSQFVNFELSAREENAIAREFESAYPQAAKVNGERDISDAAYDAELAAYKQAKVLSLPYEFGDGVDAEGITFYGDPETNFFGQPNDAMVRQVLNDPRFQALPEWDSMHFGQKMNLGITYLTGPVNELTTEYGLSLGALKRIWKGSRTFEEVPRSGREVVPPPFPEPPHEGANQGPGETSVVGELFESVGARVTSTPGQVYGESVDELAGQRHAGYDIVFGRTGDPNNNGRPFPNFFNRPVEITAVGRSSTLGNYIVIRPEGTNESISIGHLHDLEGLQRGAVIPPGEMLARQGSSGISTAPHIDVQVQGRRGDNRAINNVLTFLLMPLVEGQQ